MHKRVLILFPNKDRDGFHPNLDNVIKMVKHALSLMWLRITWKEEQLSTQLTTIENMEQLYQIV